MKENLRTENNKTRNYETEWYKIKDLNKKHSKVIEHFISSKKIIFFLFMYKMCTFSIKTWSTINIEAIKHNGKKWINEKDLEKSSWLQEFGW